MSQHYNHCQFSASGTDEPILCAACSAYTNVQNRILELKKQMAALEEEACGVRSSMNSAHDPLQKIPSEISAYIFANVPYDDSRVAAMYALGRVCRYWRQIVWETPCLWNSIVYSYDEDMKHIPEYPSFDSRFARFQKCIDRSGSLPLTINISLEESESTLHTHSVLFTKIHSLSRLLKQTFVAHRLFQARFHLPTQLFCHLEGLHTPQLRTLILSAPAPKNWEQDVSRLPSVVDLTQSTLGMETLEIVMILADDFKFSFKRLTSLKLDKCTPQNFINIMQRAPALRDCEVILSDDPFPSNSTSISLLHLSRLVIGGMDNSELEPVFHTLYAPALRDLQLDSSIDLQCLFSFFERSDRPLITLNLPSTVDTWNLSQLDSFLNQLPLLTSLTSFHSFQSSSVAEIFRTIFTPSTSTTLPGSKRAKITQFYCSVYWSDQDREDNWSFIVDLFGPDSNMQDEALDIHVSVLLERSEANMIMPIETARLIQRLQQKGWKWSIIIKRVRSRREDLIIASIKHYENSAD